MLLAPQLVMFDAGIGLEPNETVPHTPRFVRKLVPEMVTVPPAIPYAGEKPVKVSGPGTVFQEGPPGWLASHSSDAPTSIITLS
jgi:hypothetical protein